LQEVLEISLAEQDAGLGLEQGVALRVIEVGAGRDVPGRGRHHLHQAAGAGLAFGARIEPGLGAHEREHQRPVQSVAVGGTPVRYREQRAQIVAAVAAAEALRQAHLGGRQVE
jgi:hypothetical protein